MHCGWFLEKQQITGEYFLKVMLISVSLNRCLITNLSLGGPPGHSVYHASADAPFFLLLALKMLLR